MARPRCLKKKKNVAIISWGAHSDSEGQTGTSGRKSPLTTEGCNCAEHAAVHHALRFARMITSHTCDFGRITAVVQYVEHLVPREAPIRVRRYQH
jgi:hypothetical protein